MNSLILIFPFQGEAFNQVFLGIKMILFPAGAE